MHPSTHHDIPTFTPKEVNPEQPAGEVLFRVDLQILGQGRSFRWNGWAEDASDASRRAVGEARMRWRGFSFVVFSVVQVSE